MMSDMHSKDSDGLDRRRFPRLDVTLPVTMRYNGRLIPATALNVSCGGMCLSVDRHDIMAEGKVEVIFDLPSNDRDITLRGTVVRVESGALQQVGIQFTNLYSLSHETLEKYINHHQN